MDKITTGPYHPVQSAPDAVLSEVIADSRGTWQFIRHDERGRHCLETCVSMTQSEAWANAQNWQDLARVWFPQATVEPVRVA